MKKWLTIAGIICLVPAGFLFAVPFDDRLEEASHAITAGDYQKAVACYQEAIEINQKSPLAYNLLGIAYGFQFALTKDSEFKERQIKAFEKAVELDPRYWPAMTHLGMAYYSIGKKAEAALYLKKVLEMQPEHPERIVYEKVIAEAESVSASRNESGTPSPESKPAI